MSLADELRARMRLIPVYWEQHKLYARALIIAEAVEKLPEPHRFPIGPRGTPPFSYGDPALATAVEKLKEMIK